MDPRKNSEVVMKSSRKLYLIDSINNKVVLQVVGKIGPLKQVYIFIVLDVILQIKCTLAKLLFLDLGVM